MTFHAALCHLSDGLPVQDDGRPAADALRDLGAENDAAVIVVALPCDAWPASVVQEVVNYLNDRAGRTGDDLHGWHMDV